MTADDDLRRVLSGWIDEVIHHVKPDNPVDIHVDELSRRLGKDVHFSVSELVEPFKVWIDLVCERSDSLMPSICIPLKDAKALDTNLPNLDKLDEDLSYTPPSLYMMDRESFLLPRLGEYYEISIELPFMAELKHNVHFFYRVGRSKDALKYDWQEYSRTISGDYYPGGYLRQ